MRFAVHDMRTPRVFLSCLFDYKGVSPSSSSSLSVVVVVVIVALRSAKSYVRFTLREFIDKDRIELVYVNLLTFPFHWS